MKYEPVNFDHLLGTQGFSNELLKNHFQLYEGYVKNTNQLLEELEALQKQGEEKTPQFAELSRRFGWEYNGMRLHEYYFGNMSNKSVILSKDARLSGKIKEEFGTYENWKNNFIAKGEMRGIGWVILYLDVRQDRLFNVWINEHDAGHLAGAIPLLVLDVFEHAFTLDYGIKKDGYITSFFNVIHWDEVAHRFDSAPARIPISQGARHA